MNTDVAIKRESWDTDSCPNMCKKLKKWITMKYQIHKYNEKQIHEQPS